MGERHDRVRIHPLGLKQSDRQAMNLAQRLVIVQIAVSDRDEHDHGIGHLQHFGEVLIQADMGVPGGVIVAHADAQTELPGGGHAADQHRPTDQDGQPPPAQQQPTPALCPSVFRHTSPPEKAGRV